MIYEARHGRNLAGNGCDLFFAYYNSIYLDQTVATREDVSQAAQ